MPFKLILRDTNEKAFRTFFWFLFCMHLVVAGVFALRASGHYIITGCCIFTGIYFLLLIFYWVSRKRETDFFKYVFPVYLVHVALWIVLKIYIALAIVVLLILFAELIRKRKTFLSFNKDEILFQQILFSKKYPWQQLDNVILKDGLLTVDFKNNQLLQAEVEQYGDDFTEFGFNEFCKDLLVQHAT